MTSPNTPKDSPAERRHVARKAKEGASDDLSWEDKVLKRVGKHVKPLDPSSKTPSDSDVGWEAASLEVLKQHTLAAKDTKTK